MPRTILHASQNETVRKTKDQDVDLATYGLFNTVAVIIKDKRGKASLTHVDGATDLRFIPIEIEKMDGEYTLDIIQPFPEETENDRESAWSIRIKDKLSELGMDHIPASKNKRVHYVKHNAVLLRNNTTYQIKMEDFHELSCLTLPGIYNISATNQLKNDRLECCTHNPTQEQGDIYISQLNALFSERMPKIVHDADGWHRQPTLISEQLKALISEKSILEVAEEYRNKPPIIRIDPNGQIDADPFHNIRAGFAYILPKLPRNLAEQRQVAEELGNIPEECPWIREMTYFTSPVAAVASVASVEIPVTSAYRV